MCISVYIYLQDILLCVFFLHFIFYKIGHFSFCFIHLLFVYSFIYLLLFWCFEMQHHRDTKCHISLSYRVEINPGPKLQQKQKNTRPLFKRLLSFIWFIFYIILAFPQRQARKHWPPVLATSHIGMTQLDAPTSISSLYSFPSIPLSPVSYFYISWHM